MNLLLVLLVGLVFNQATAENPVNTPQEIKAAVVKSLSDVKPVDYSKMND